MELNLAIEPLDINKVRVLIQHYKSDSFVERRMQRNVGGNLPEPTKDLIWKEMVHALLTSRQSVKPGSAVSQFKETEPYPLCYAVCVRQQSDLRSFVAKTIVDFNNTQRHNRSKIRNYNRIAGFIEATLPTLVNDSWQEMMRFLEKLRDSRNEAPSERIAAERAAADYIEQFSGYGPKQARNVLQELGLTRYEIPLDSRVTKWLSKILWFPIPLSPTALGDRDFYCYILGIIKELCDRSETFPCILDASIMAMNGI